MISAERWRTEWKGALAVPFFAASYQTIARFDKLPVSEADTWAHLAVSGNEWFVRELDGLMAYRWGD